MVRVSMVSSSKSFQDSVFFGIYSHLLSKKCLMNDSLSALLSIEIWYLRDSRKSQESGSVERPGEKLKWRL